MFVYYFYKSVDQQQFVLFQLRACICYFTGRFVGALRTQNWDAMSPNIIGCVGVYNIAQRQQHCIN